MAATITASGTFSTIAASELPVVHRDTVEERYDFESMIAETALTTNAGGFPELMQFIGLFADGYNITAPGAMVRLTRMLEILQNRTRETEERRYTP